MSTKKTTVIPEGKRTFVALILVALTISASFVKAGPHRLRAFVPVVKAAPPLSNLADTPSVHKKTIVEKNKEQPIAKAAESDATPLDEAMVMAYTNKKKAATTTANIKEAHPQTGWISFERYINDKATSPDGKTGMVELSFTVNYNGVLTDFKATKGISDATDKAAIEIIKKGPLWTGAANKQPEQVTVKVNFHQAD